MKRLEKIVLPVLLGLSFFQSVFNFIEGYIFNGIVMLMLTILETICHFYDLLGEDK